MSSINKFQLPSSSDIYDISPSPSGILDTTSTVKFTSNDVEQSSATSYISVNKIEATETNSSIFGKLTSMVRNIRFIYNSIGTTDISSIGSTITSAITALSTALSGKASASHSHSVSDLPVSASQVNSNEYIPTSALVYSMDQKIKNITISSSSPSGGSNGDIWIKYTN